MIIQKSDLKSKIYDISSMVDLKADEILCFAKNQLDEMASIEYELSIQSSLNELDKILKNIENKPFNKNDLNFCNEILKHQVNITKLMFERSAGNSDVANRTINYIRNLPSYIKDNLNLKIK